MSADAFTVGVLSKRGRFVVAEPFFERGARVVVEPDRNARDGQLVLVRSGGGGGRGHKHRGGGGRAKVVRVIGRPDVARDVLEALMLHRGLRLSFPAGVERAAQEAVQRVQAAGDDPSRRDLRDLTTFTIDPVTAKDFDDAVSAQQLAPDRWRIWVHIADVSAYLRPGSPVDREAYRRGTSVYVPGAVEPMLPEVLSNGACSLVPGQDRLAVTVEMDLHGATVARSAFYRSRIRSDVRLDYDRVDRIFAGEEPALPPWAEPLGAARAASAALRARREELGALAVESSEPEFAFDRGGHITLAEQTLQTESHQLIEYLMIAANEAVARLLSERGVPALYRIHERPEPAAAQRLVEQLASLGVPTPPMPEHLGPREAADAIAQASQLVAAEVRRRGGAGRLGLTSLVLRALKQARYAPENRGHAGLHSDAYCHFTSPIRRYPDLICHRALLSAVGREEDAPRAAILEEAGRWTSGRERDAMSIERDADDVARAFLLERTLFEGGIDREFDGEVIGLIGAGAFVAFGDGYEGLLPVRRLRGDWFELNEQGTILQGAESGRAIRIGDQLRVLVRGVDPPRGRVDLDLSA